MTVTNPSIVELATTSHFCSAYFSRTQVSFTQAPVFPLRWHTSDQSSRNHCPAAKHESNHRVVNHRPTTKKEHDPPPPLPHTHIRFTGNPVSPVGTSIVLITTGAPDPTDYGGGDEEGICGPQPDLFHWGTDLLRPFPDGKIFSLLALSRRFPLPCLFACACVCVRVYRGGGGRNMSLVYAYRQVFVVFCAVCMMIVYAQRSRLFVVFCVVCCTTYIIMLQSSLEHDTK